MWPVSQASVFTWSSTDALKLQVCKAHLDEQVTKESQEVMVSLGPQVPQAHPALYVTFMGHLVLQDLQETLD